MNVGSMVKFVTRGWFMLQIENISLNYLTVCNIYTQGLGKGPKGCKSIVLVTESSLN